MHPPDIFYPHIRFLPLGMTTIKKEHHLFCGRQWTLSVKPAAGRAVRPHERLFPSLPLSHQQIPLPGTEHRERGIFDPSAEFFMFPLDNSFVLMYYCHSTSELIGGAARMSRCDCSDPSAAQAKEDAYGMGYPQ